MLIQMQVVLILAVHLLCLVKLMPIRIKATVVTAPMGQLVAARVMPVRQIVRARHAGHLMVAMALVKLEAVPLVAVWQEYAIVRQTVRVRHAGQLMAAVAPVKLAAVPMEAVCQEFATVRLTALVLHAGELIAAAAHVKRVVAEV